MLEENLAVKAPPRTLAPASDVGTPPAREGEKDFAACEGASGSAQPDQEVKTDWINDLIRSVWPYARRSVESMAKETIPELLEVNRPSFVHDLELKNFDLGDCPVSVGTPRVVSDPAVVPEVFIETEVEWRSKLDVSLHISVPRLPLKVSEVVPNSVEKGLQLFMSVTVSVRNVWMRGRIRCSLRPLLNRIPTIGGLRISLVEPPEFDYEVHMGPMLETILPLVRGWVDATIRDQIAQQIVVPEHVWLPIADNVSDNENPSAILSVTVKKATRVKRGDFFGKGDPYIELFLRDTQRRTTKVCHGTSDPVWNETFLFPVPVPEHQQLKLTIWDRDEWSPPDDLGRAVIDVKEICQDGSKQDLVVGLQQLEKEAEEDAKEDASFATRALISVGKLLRSRTPSHTKIHLEVASHKLSEDERMCVKEALEGSGLAAAAHWEGRLSAPVRALILSGTVVLNLKRVEQLPLRGRLRTPHVKAVLSVGSESRDCDESPIVLASRGGAVEFPEPLGVFVGPDLVQKAPPAPKINIRLKENGWGSTHIAGFLSFPLDQLLARRKIAGVFDLQDAKQGKADLELVWEPYLA